jgi:hypothetical protein
MGFGNALHQSQSEAHASGAGALGFSAANKLLKNGFALSRRNSHAMVFDSQQNGISVASCEYLDGTARIGVLCRVFQ